MFECPVRFKLTLSAERMFRKTNPKTSSLSAESLIATNAEAEEQEDIRFWNGTRCAHYPFGLCARVESTMLKITQDVEIPEIVSVSPVAFSRVSTSLMIRRHTEGSCKVTG